MRHFNWIRTHTFLSCRWLSARTKNTRKFGRIWGAKQFKHPTCAPTLDVWIVSLAYRVSGIGFKVALKAGAILNRWCIHRCKRISWCPLISTVCIMYMDLGPTSKRKGVRSALVTFVVDHVEMSRIAQQQWTPSKEIRCMCARKWPINLFRSLSVMHRKTWRVSQV